MPWGLRGEDGSGNQDDYALARVGKKPILKRQFGFMSILGFSCTILATWEGILSTFTMPFENGGPAGTIYSFIIVWAGICATFITMSELVSMAPTSGGQYHWVSMLSPPSCQKYMSFVTGWLIVIGWLGAFASSAYLSSSQIQGLIVLDHSSYVAQPWHTLLLYWAVTAFTVFVNVFASSLLPKFEGLVLVIHIIGFFAILIPLVYLGERNSAKEVFTTFSNGGGWQTEGLSFLIGMTGNMFAFTGADAAVHMSEEIQNSAVVVPICIMTTVVLNGLLGLGMIMAALFTMTDVEAALNSSTGYPFMEIFLSATKSVPGSTVMSALIPILVVATAVGCLASSSRMVWSFARDRGMPGSSWLSKVSSQAVPQYAISVVTGVGALLGLIILGSSAVLNDVVSLTVSALYGSYLLCAALFLYNRLMGNISSPADPSSDSDVVVNTPGAPLVWGPFRLPPVLGVICNVCAVVYLTVGIFFSFWPSDRQTTSEAMNYAVVGTAGTLILSTIYYFLYAKRVYTGPVVEIDRT
ncbi:hypothetical protein ASPWEDRAFT_99221 [Aspergillus wentii DTO 134E9]|uniref:Amino acid permease/ SLC12A domain-containing protein n=1 Tax=Aspergillus wentii DTO 134E9 TaxID=1073089 RepID=A0A1L9S0P5_ASPWE|nr:uncharacterized protein ASPWEDRAFT_99221 [Aspergillus wentii DTO 134E9]OJJ40723.1 hypothetical protein ASPWEDRAFT_99221 [Aspergillus wentii DTO 134E9]